MEEEMFVEAWQGRIGGYIDGGNSASLRKQNTKGGLV